MTPSGPPPPPLLTHLTPGPDVFLTCFGLGLTPIPRGPKMPKMNGLKIWQRHQCSTQTGVGDPIFDPYFGQIELDQKNHVLKDNFFEKSMFLRTAAGIYSLGPLKTQVHQTGKVHVLTRFQNSVMNPSFRPLRPLILEARQCSAYNLAWLHFVLSLIAQVSQRL